MVILLDNRDLDHVKKSPFSIMTSWAVKVSHFGWNQPQLVKFEVSKQRCC